MLDWFLGLDVPSQIGLAGITVAGIVVIWGVSLIVKSMGEGD